jgi:hypothetical protein
MATVNKLKLEIEIDFKIIGLASNTEDYKLCWLLNNHLKWNLKRVADLPAIESKKVISLFDNDNLVDEIDSGHTMFSHVDEDLFIDNHLIANISSNGFLIPEFKQYNYFIFLKGDVVTNDQVLSVIEKLQHLEAINASFVIPHQSIKDINNLLF